MTFKYSMPPHFKRPRKLARSPRLTIAQIVRSTTQRTKARSKVVAIVEGKQGRTPKAYRGYKTYKFHTKNMENGHQYRLTIFTPETKVKMDSKVVIDSPNPLWIFRFEYSMAKRGNALIYRSNGDPPVVTNPRQRPGCDHHVFKCLQWLVRNT